MRLAVDASQDRAYILQAGAHAPRKGDRMTLAHRLACIALLGTAVLAPAGLAQQTPACADTLFQRELNACAAQRFETAAALLDIVYTTALDRTKAVDANAVADDTRPPGAEAALRRAHTAWADYRDAHCDAVASQSYGGSMAPMVISACKIDLTELRMRELQDLIDDLAN